MEDSLSNDNLQTLYSERNDLLVFQATHWIHYEHCHAGVSKNSSLGIKFGELLVKETSSYSSISFGHPDIPDQSETICFECPKHENQTGEKLLLDHERDDGATFVNAKQYKRIKKRREARAKDQYVKRDKKRRSFLHLSRHKHAKRRARGADGRFVDTKPTQSCKNGNDENEDTNVSCSC